MFLAELSLFFLSFVCPESVFYQGGPDLFGSTAYSQMRLLN